MHGVSSKIIFTKEESIFKNIPNQIQVGHYHSWVIDEKTLPNCFEVTSKNEDGMIMSIKHKEYDLKGVQFHPESILTQHGLLMIKNWIFS
jgi:anthranilate synthase component 2